MSQATAESIKQLAQRYGHIMKSLNHITGVKDSSEPASQPELLTIIHRPGWTSVIDVALVNEGLDALEQQVKAIEKLPAGSPSAKPGTAKERETTALVVMNGLNRGPLGVSKEIKQFVEGRSGLQPDGLHVVFVLRASRG